MEQFADILAFDRNGQLALIVEVKNKRETSISWAENMRRNLFAHGILPRAPYFLLALPDRFYLWHDEPNEPTLTEPTRQIDPSSFLEYYYRTSGISAESLTGRSFEYIVTSWLHRVLQTKDPLELEANGRDWLVETGLFERLTGGHLEMEAAA